MAPRVVNQVQDDFVNKSLVFGGSNFVGYMYLQEIDGQQEKKQENFSNKSCAHSTST